VKTLTPNAITIPVAKVSNYYATNFGHSHTLNPDTEVTNMGFIQWLDTIIKALLCVQVQKKGRLDQLVHAI